MSPTIRFLIIKGSRPPSEYYFEQEAILLGRLLSSEEGLDLGPDNQVSHQHARISYGEGAYWIEDLGSTNGTWLNGRKVIARTRLTSGDRLLVGNTIVEVQADVPDDVDVTDRPDTSPLPAEADDNLPDGVMTSNIPATQEPAALIFPPELSPEESRDRLTVFYDLGEALGKIDSLDELAETVVVRLRKALSKTQPVRLLTGLLLYDGENLVLKNWYPRDNNPAVSFSLARYAAEHREGFVWQYDMPGKMGVPKSAFQHGIKSAIYVPLLADDKVLGVLCANNMINDADFKYDDLQLAQALATQTALFIKSYKLQQTLRQEEVRRANLLRQFSPKVATQILKYPNSIVISGERVEPATILVSDIRSFTSMSAEMDPQDVVQMLNAMFSKLTPILFDCNGTVDKFTGDGILAVFGSPEPDERQCQNAVRAALEMQAAIDALDTPFPFQIGIGIHTGVVVHGFVGSPERMEYTVIGDTVNRTVRICDGAGPGEILISRAVYETVGDSVEARPKQITTKNLEMTSYVVVGMKE